MDYVIHILAQYFFDSVLYVSYILELVPTTFVIPTVVLSRASCHALDFFFFEQLFLFSFPCLWYPGLEARCVLMTIVITD